MNGFYKRIKLKTHFRDNTKVKGQTGEFRKKKNYKKCAPNKNHYVIETFIEATKNEVKDDLKTICACK